MRHGYEREFTSVYGAVSPLDGVFDPRLCEKMNTEEMGRFLAQVSQTHPEDFILMVLDGASSHKAKALEVPAHLVLIPWPASSPQLNPQENLWDELREKNFPHHVFDSMEAVRTQLLEELKKFAPKPGGGELLDGLAMDQKITFLKANWN